ncbi:MAG: hypothetical protein ACK4WB_03130, partial [Desulfatiglandales bacterium]
TRLKEFSEGEEKYIFERMQTRHLSLLLTKTAHMLELVELAKDLTLGGTQVGINPPLLVLTDGGNAYILRRKIEAIHWDEALEQLHKQDLFFQWTGHLNLEGLIKRLLNKLHAELEDFFRKELPFDFFTYFISWNLRTNQPRVVVEFHRSFYQKVWIA